MIPIKFSGANTTFKPPIGSVDIEPLPVNRGPELTVSCWQVDIAERLRILRTGKVWMTVKGHRMPPIHLSAKKPPLAKSTP